MKRILVYSACCALLGSIAVLSFSSFKSSETSAAIALDAKKDLSEGYLVLSDVLSDLSSLGANATTAPPDWTPPASFSGYNGIYHYDLNGVLYSVFAWDSPLNEDFLSGKNECHHKWYSSNGDCKDSGSECDVTVENGKTIIICADE